MPIEFKRLVYQDAIPTKVSELENDVNYIKEEKLIDALEEISYDNITDTDIAPFGHFDALDDSQIPTSKAVSNYVKNEILNIPSPTIPNKLSDLEIDMELGVNEQEVLNIVNTNSTNTEGTFLITSSSEYAGPSDMEIPTTAVVQMMLEVLAVDTDKESYSKEEINSLISAIPKFNIEVVTELPIENISSTTIYLKTIIGDTSNLYEEYIYVNNAWEKLGTQTVSLTGYAKEEDIPTKVSELENDKGYLTQHQSLTGYAKTTDIPTKTSQLTNDSGYLTQHQSLSGYAKTSDIPTKTSQLTNDSNFLTSVPSEYAKKSEVPTKTSQLTNDSGYLTQHQSLTEYAKKSELPTKTSQLTNDSNFLTSVPDTYAKKTDIITNNINMTNGAGYITSSALSSYAKTNAIPTKTSQLTNDSNFATKSEVATAIAAFVEATDEEIEALFK